MRREKKRTAAAACLYMRTHTQARTHTRTGTRRHTHTYTHMRAQAPVLAYPHSHTCTRPNTRTHTSTSAIARAHAPYIRGEPALARLSPLWCVLPALPRNRGTAGETVRSGVRAGAHGQRGIRRLTRRQKAPSSCLASAGSWARPATPRLSRATPHSTVKGQRRGRADPTTQVLCAFAAWGAA